ncbi:two-component system, response regulator YesN [Paenibacillus tianmuensis]|uniref:Two-component system, response regulator YesN n=1 Tax=Paenibacillus tianmuensis TaxID=624147 RepID=A0A1G4PPM0_9BACL|nr:two-component system, response regulator YesN [Paenibacillus tianmuensis]
MLKMIIVDDEKKTVEGIKECLDWTDYGIVIAGQARNGSDGLDLAVQVRPDIVLTDIRMPVMDGIEFSRELRRLLPETKIIFITGYSDLAYMKSAFKEGIIDYILKPIDIDELESVIRKTAELCEIEKKKEQNRQELESRLHESIPLLRDQFLSMLILGEIGEKDLIGEKMRHLAIDLPVEDTGYLVFVVDVDDYTVICSDKEPFELKQLSMEIISIAQKTIDGKGIMVQLNEGELAGIIPSRTAHGGAIAESAGEWIQTLQNGLNRDLDLSVTIGVGEWVNSVEKISFSYYRAVHAINQKLYRGKNHIIYADNVSILSEKDATFGYKIYEQTYAALKAGDMDKARLRIEDVFEHLNRSCSLQYVQSVCLQFTAVFQRIYAEYADDRSEDPTLDVFAITNELFRLETIEDMKQFVLTHCTKVCNYVATGRDGQSQIVDYIKSLIEERYAENVTIELIAKEVFLSPAYTSLLFKQKTGETINGFLTRVRIEKAKELLRQGSSKLYEICLDVGYSDPKYFSKLFKKITGLSPSEYK